MPLLRDRAIDPRRGELYKATIGRRIADLGIDQQRMFIVQLATRRYWDWVAAGRRLQVARAVLDVAMKRDRQLKDAADLGQIPQIDVTDNQQAILNRRQQAIGAERGLQQAAIDLSLFYRDSAGNPVLVSEGSLPSGFPEIHDLGEERLKEDVELALARRPEIQRFSAQRDQMDVDLRLARNLLLPALDLGVTFYQDMGAHVISRGPTVLTAGVNFEMPVQRRQAKGLEAAALARIEQLDQRDRFARDQVTAEVRDAHSAVTHAFRQAQVLHEQTEITHQLEDAERVRFDLGEGTLFLINLREQISFDTALREIGAINEYYRALALYEFAIAEGLTRRPAVRP